MNYSVYDLGTNISQNNMDTETFFRNISWKTVKKNPKWDGFEVVLSLIFKNMKKE